MRGFKFHLIYQDNQLCQKHEEFTDYETLASKAREVHDKTGVSGGQVIFGRKITGLMEYYSFKHDIEKGLIPMTDKILRNAVYKKAGVIHISEKGFVSQMDFNDHYKDSGGIIFLGFIDQPYGDLQEVRG